LSLYLDTSVLVAMLTAEADGQQVEEWLRSRGPEELLVSDWVIAEFSAALSRKLRMRQIDVAQRAGAHAEFSQICSRSATVLEISRYHFRTAARFADDHVSALRGGDALHLAVAFEYGATLCTLDRRLAEAGPPLGVQTVTIATLFP
jgi:predicted nucleic acid-binding protein